MHLRLINTISRLIKNDSYFSIFLVHFRSYKCAIVIICRGAKWRSLSCNLIFYYGMLIIFLMKRISRMQPSK